MLSDPAPQSPAFGCFLRTQDISVPFLGHPKGSQEGINLPATALTSGIPGKFMYLHETQLLHL